MILGLGDETDSSIREQCANGIAEFFRWFIKQGSKKEVAEQPGSADSLLKELFSMASHPAEIKRLGAAITFKNIYKDFREESSLIGRYALSIIYKLLLSLRLTSSNVRQLEVFDVIDKYTTIVLKSVKDKEDSGSLLAINKLRDFPQNVEELVTWSWTNCTSPNLYFRRGCMNCFDVLACLIKWPINKETSSSIIIEDSMILSIDKQLETALKDIDNNFNEKSMNIVAGVVDFLQWTISKNYIKASDLLGIDINTKKRKIDNFSNIFIVLKTLSNFIERSSLIENRSLFNEIVLMDLDQNISSYIQELRSELFRRILDFMLLCIKKDKRESCTWFVSNGLWNPGMHSLIIRALFRSKYDNLFPSKNTSNSNMDSYIKPIISELLMNITSIEETCTIDTNSLKHSFITYIKNFLNKLKVPSKIDDDDMISIINTIDILEKNNVLSILLDSETLLELKSVGKTLLEYALMSSESDDPIIVKICSTIMIYSIKIQCIPFVSINNEMTILSCLQSTNGFYFYKRHKQLITTTIIDRVRISFIQDLNIIPFLMKVACSSFINEVTILTKDDISMNEADPILALTICSLDHLIKDIVLLPNIAISSIITKCIIAINELDYVPTIIKMKLVQLDSKISSELRNIDLRKIINDDAIKTFSKSNNLSIKAIVSHIEFLPYILNGTTLQSVRHVSKYQNDTINEEIANSLEEMVALKFPLDWEHHDPKSNEGGDFIYLLGSYLQVIIQSGAISLLKPLFSTFREGKKNPYYRYIIEMFHSLVDGIDVSDGSIGMFNIDIITSYCYDVFKNDYEDIEIKELLCDCLCLPLLRKCSSDTLSNFLVSSKFLSMSILSSSNVTLVKKLVDTINIYPIVSQRTKLFINSFIYSLFEILYSRCHIQTIKDQVTKGYNPNVIRDNELTIIITKCITDNCLNVDLETDDIISMNFIQRFYSTAFSCIATIISKTQSNLAFYEKILFNENKYWCKAIDCNIIYSFQKALSKPFKTEFISNSKGNINTTIN